MNRFGGFFFIAFGAVWMAGSFSNWFKISWNRGGPYHPLRAWERFVTFAIGLAAVGAGIMLLRD